MMPGEMRLNEIEHFALRFSRIRLLDENLVGNRRVESALLGEIHVEVVADLDPFGKIKRLQADAERL
jgi:hypothetical protein